MDPLTQTSPSLSIANIPAAFQQPEEDVDIPEKMHVEDAKYGDSPLPSYSQRQKHDSKEEQTSGTIAQHHSLITLQQLKNSRNKSFQTGDLLKHKKPIEIVNPTQMEVSSNEIFSLSDEKTVQYRTSVCSICFNETTNIAPVEKTEYFANNGNSKTIVKIKVIYKDPPKPYFSISNLGDITRPYGKPLLSVARAGTQERPIYVMPLMKKHKRR